MVVVRKKEGWGKGAVVVEVDSSEEEERKGRRRASTDDGGNEEKVVQVALIRPGCLLPRGNFLCLPCDRHVTLMSRLIAPDFLAFAGRGHHARLRFLMSSTACCDARRCRASQMTACGEHSSVATVQI